MISIIICSRSKQKLQEVSESVAATIGVVFEIVAIDNEQGQYSIFQAYNLGVARSQYGLLCFMHEDVVIKTQAWGIKLQAIFQENTQLGLVGVAGSSYKTKMPSHWSYPNSLNKTIFVNIIQHYQSANKTIHHLNNPRRENLSHVVAVDGVWFCAKRAVFEKVAFDETLFSNFHCYDVDFSLSVYQHYKVAVTFDILIEHLSEGKFNEIWLRETIKLHHKWGSKLPINLEGLDQKEQYIEEKSALVDFVAKMIDNKFLDLSIVDKIWIKGLISRFGYARFLGFNASVGKIIYKKYLGVLLNR